MQNNNIKTATVRTASVKTTYWQEETPKQLVKALGDFVQHNGALKVPSVHKGTGELIADKAYYDLAVEQGAETIEVNEVEIPDAELLHAVATHFSPPKKWVNRLAIYHPLMELYNKQNGVGARYRESFGADIPLKEFVAKCCLGTNRTYIDRAIAIAEYDMALLAEVDDKKRKLNETYFSLPGRNQSKVEDVTALAPQGFDDLAENGNLPTGDVHNISTEPEADEAAAEFGVVQQDITPINKEGIKGGKTIKKNYSVKVNSLAELTDEEAAALVNSLPARLSYITDETFADSGIYIAKAYSQKDVLLSISYSYEFNGKTVNTQIVDEEQLGKSISA